MKVSWAVPVIVSILILGGLGISQAYAATTVLGPSLPYLSFSDSPFSGVDFSSGYFHLEDFESGSLSTPGASSITGVTFSGTDSVDIDDRILDGIGNAVYFFNGSVGPLGNFPIEIFFSDATLGDFPTHVGIVVTRSNWIPAVAGVHVEFFDPSGTLVQTTDLPTLQGGSSDDTFVGIIHDGGISKIEIRQFSPADFVSAAFVNVDHLQYGFAINEQILVGATSIPIDTTSLLLAGASVNAWMIPVVLSAAGFGLLIARKL